MIHGHSERLTVEGTQIFTHHRALKSDSVYRFVSRRRHSLEETFVKLAVRYLCCKCTSIHYTLYNGDVVKRYNIIQF